MSEELIKKSDAIKAIENTDWYHQNRNKDMVSGANSDEHQAWYKADDVYKALEAIPTIEPKRGKWIEDICKYDRAYHFKCSVCGEWNGLSVEEWNWKPNFCPNCGARMKGESDEIYSR